MSLYHRLLKALYPPGVYSDEPGSIHDQLVQTYARGLELARRERAAKCPHGREWLDCNACMIAGDLAYDAAREARIR